MALGLRGMAIVAAALAAISVACRSTSDATGGIEGALAIRERIALTPGATYRVRAFVRHGETAVQVAGVQGPAAATPIPFRLNWSLRDVGAGPVTIEAELFDAGRRWTLPDVLTVPPRGDRETLGLVLVAAR